MLTSHLYYKANDSAYKTFSGAKKMFRGNPACLNMDIDRYPGRPKNKIKMVPAPTN